MTRIFLSAPDVRDGDRDALIAAFDSGWIAPVGPELDAFERELAAATGRSHAVALASGTAAIHLGLLELGVGPGDEVLVSTLTFAGSAFPVRYAGAEPVFIDSETTTWNMSPQLLAAELAELAARGAPLPKAAIVVDLYGRCADHDAIGAILDGYGIPMLEDAAEAIGAELGGRRAGSFGALGALSFNGNKLVTSSGGGALVTDDEQAAQRARSLATQARRPVLHYEHTEIGFNYRLSNLLAALGRSQLAALEERIARRRQIHDGYAELVAAWEGVELAPVPAGQRVNHWLTCATVEADRAGVTVAELIAALDGADIEARPLWKPMHQQPVFAGCRSRLDGTADRLFATGICLPSGSGMSGQDLDRVLAVLGRLRPAS